MRYSDSSDFDQFLHLAWFVLSDPFGHSNFMATAFALMGMNSWFFGRIDYQVSFFLICHRISSLMTPFSPCCVLGS